MRLSKKEAPYFAPPEYADIIRESEREGEFEVVTLSFDDRYKWRFTDGNATFTVDILDDYFLHRLQRREISFGRGDILRVRLSVKTYKTEKGLKTEYAVREVLGVIPAPTQMSLLPEPRKKDKH